MSRQTAEVAVVGAGIIGVLTAWRLRSQGVDVLLVAPAGAGAATAASAAVVRTVCDEPLLAARSLAWYREWDAGAGKPWQALNCAGVAVVVPPESAPAAAVARRLVTRRHSWPVGAPGEAPPALVAAGYQVRSGTVCWEPEAGYAHPGLMVLSVLRAFIRAGGRRMPGRVRSLRAAGRGWQLSGPGLQIRASRVLLATGAATPRLLPEPLVCPVGSHPVALGLFARPDRDWRCRPTVVDLANGVLLRPVRAGLLGTVRGPGRSAAFLAGLQAACWDLVPGLRGVGPNLVAESNFDVTPDGQPYLGAVADGLFVAYGFNGGGFKLAPALTEEIASMLVSGRPPAAFARFTPRAGRRVSSRLKGLR